MYNITDLNLQIASKHPVALVSSSYHSTEKSGHSAWPTGRQRPASPPRASHLTELVRKMPMMRSSSAASTCSPHRATISGTTSSRTKSQRGSRRRAARWSISLSTMAQVAGSCRRTASSRSGATAE